MLQRRKLQFPSHNAVDLGRMPTVQQSPSLKLRRNLKNLQCPNHTVADLARKGNAQRSPSPNPSPNRPQKTKQSLRLNLPPHPNHVVGLRRRPSVQLNVRQNPRQKLARSKSHQNPSLQSNLVERLVSLEGRASLLLFIVSPMPLLWPAESLLPTILETRKAPPTSSHHASGPRCLAAVVSTLPTC
jgi:hypothetical protein